MLESVRLNSLLCCAASPVLERMLLGRGFDLTRPLSLPDQPLHAVQASLGLAWGDAAVALPEAPELAAVWACAD